MAQAPDIPLTTRELQERLMSMLGGAHERILREVIGHYPRQIEKDALGEQVGYSNTRSKGFQNALGRLRTLGLIEYPATGQVRASDMLFLDKAASA